MTCTFPECGRAVHARQLCTTHYKQNLYQGQMRPIGRRKRLTCAFPGCDRAHHSFGFCSSHVKQYKTGRKLTPIGEYLRLARERMCSFPGCGRKHEAHGFCDTHAGQFRAGLPLRPIQTQVCRDTGASLPFEPIRAYAVAHGHTIPWGGGRRWVTVAEADELCVRAFRVHPFFVYGDAWWDEDMEEVA